MASLGLSTNLLAENRALDSLPDLRWKNRIVLVENATDQTISELVDHRGGIDERQIVWFCVVNGEIQSNYQGELAGGFLDHLREDYFKKTGFPVLLIGKDGWVKSSNPSLDIDDYFAQIDAMPMRQAEMVRLSSD